MKTTSILCLLLYLCPLLIYAQVCEELIVPIYAELNGNAIATPISPAGNDFFEDGINGDYRNFRITSEVDSPVTIFASSLWLSGITSEGEYRAFSETYGVSGNDATFYYGPLNSDGSLFAENCDNFNRVWQVKAIQIEAHIADYADNGIIDNPQEDILGWPGLGNPHFLEIYGFSLPNNGDLASFKDFNNNGIYEPLKGEYPVEPHDEKIPSHMTFDISNTVNPFPDMQPLRAEIHNTYWAFFCPDDRLAHHTIFARHDIINRGQESLEDLSAGIWADVDIGCYLDDFVGSNPNQNSFFAYNMDNYDESDCQYLESGAFGGDPPVQAVTFLDKPLEAFIAHFQGPAVDPPLAVTFPQSWSSVYFAMRGRWNDGSPLLSSGTGYNQSDGEETTFHYSGNPLVTGEWSLLDSEYFWTHGAWDCIGSTNLGPWTNGDRQTLDIAYSYHREADRDFLGNVELMYDDVGDLQSYYDNDFQQACSPSAVSHLNVSNIEIFPNPVIDQLNFKIPAGRQIEELQVLDISGKLLRHYNQPIHSIAVDDLAAGTYLLILRASDQVYRAKFTR